MKKALFFSFILSLFLLVPAGVKAVNVGEDIVSYWSFDNEDTINDSISVDIVGDNNGSIDGAITNVSGRVGESYEFDGNNDIIVVDGVDDLPKQEVSVAVWVNPYVIKSSSVVDTNPDRSSDRFNAHVPWNDNNIYWDFGDKDADGRISYAPNNSLKDKWSHFVLVSSYSGSFMKIYQDGELVKSKSKSSSYSGETRDLLFGHHENGDQFFEGKIDEIAIWNQSLNDSEVEVIYNRTRTGNRSYLNDYSGDKPLVTNFSTSYGTTDFGSVNDLANVSNMTLAISNSKVSWKNSVNAKGENYDNNVKLSQGLVSVNSSALHSSINSSATVSLDVSSCSSFNIYKSDKPVDSLSELKSQGSVVGDESGCSSSYCSNISCSSGELTYDVQHFSSTGSDSTSGDETVPTFTEYTLLLAVAITILGFYAIRK